MSAFGGAWVHDGEFTVAGSMERTFAALIEPPQLERWFAERVEVEAREGGAYRFWGQHTYGVPGPQQAKQRITRLEPGRLLAYRWDFDGSGSEVALRLEPGPPQEGGDPRTRLALRHAFDSRLAIPYARELVDDLWRLTLGNLDAHLRGGDGIVLPNYADPKPEIRLSIVIDAPRERVFRALIDPTEMNRWIASDAQVDARVGGQYRYGWTYEVEGRRVEGGPTRILDLVENERLVTDWLDWRGDESRRPTRLAWLLESQGSRTKLTVIHGEFSRTADIGDYPFGWSEFLQALRAHAEGRELPSRT